MEGTNVLAKKFVRGVLWNYGTFASGKLLVFISTVILARILVPEDFGLLALGLVALNYLDVLADFGVGSALIYRQEDPERMASVAFWVSLLTGIVLTTFSFVAAPLVADFFDEPRVTDIFRALSLSFVIATYGSIQEAMLRKSLDFRRRFIPQITRTLFKGAISIGLALMGHGAWSLVWGQLGGVCAEGIMYWVTTRWHPKLVFDLKLARLLVSYGFQLILMGFLSAIIRNIDYLFIGRNMDAEQLGIYTLAYRLPELVIISLVVVVSQALFPAYARIQNDENALRKGFLAMLQVMTTITFPLGVGMLIIAPEFVRLFYTGVWEDAIPVMQVLAIFAMIGTLHYNSGDVYKAIGRPGLLNMITVIRVIYSIPIMMVVSRYTILHVAYGQLLITVIQTLLVLLLTCYTLKVRPAEIVGAVVPAALSVTTMLAISMLLRLWLEGASDAARMALLIGFSVLVYAGVTWLINRATLMKGLQLVMPRKKQDLPLPVKDAA